MNSITDAEPRPNANMMQQTERSSKFNTYYPSTSTVDLMPMQ